MRARLFVPVLTALAVAWALPARALTEKPALPPAESLPNPFILDPGHGGEDLGAVVGGKMEKDIALSIARKIKDRLDRLGKVPVRLTRDSDIFLPLDQRVHESVELHGAAFVSLHLNQVRYKQLQGITVYSFGKTRHLGLHLRRRRKVAPLPPPPKEAVRASAALAESIARSLRAQGFRAGPPERAEFYVLKNPSIPSILIELGYLSNPEEASRLNDPPYQDRLADALASSLQSYLALSRPALASAK